MYREPAAPSEAIELHRLAPRRWWCLREDDVEGFLGARVLVGRRAYTSLDRTRRVRFVADDAEARFELIDPARGITRRSHRRSVGLPRRADASIAPRSVWTAPVIGRPLRPVCFVGARAAPDPRMVRVLAYDDGVLVVRVTSRGVDAGDTWHASLDDALGQLDRELGAHLGALRAGDRRRPWRRDDPWGAPQGSRSTHTV
ncbi:MAG: hypothetical protein H6719_26775 [Sandaracinaceae bacterium]|nr:hypothetical protein [Sandaracinaceae bacterium]